MVRNRVVMTDKLSGKLVYTGINLSDLKHLVEIMEKTGLEKDFYVRLEVPIRVGFDLSESEMKPFKGAGTRPKNVFDDYFWPFGASTDGEIDENSEKKCDTFEEATDE